MAAKKVKTAEVDGIKFEYDEARLNDMRVVLAIGALTDEEETDEIRKMVWYSRLLVLLFPSPYEVMSQLADANGGSCSPEVYNAWLPKALEAMQAKN